MDDTVRMFEAHVSFELDRWRGRSARLRVEEIVDGLLGWLGPMTVADLVEPGSLVAWLQLIIAEVPTPEGMAVAESTVLDAYRALLAEDGVPLGEIVPRSSYDQFVSGAIGMTEIRQEVIAQITTNSVYSGLISNVLYHGIKKYLITENPVVRRVPGASSLLRAGGNAVRSATPRLSPRLGEGINRRLVAFIQANVQETVKDSGRFLDGVLDDEMLRTLVDEIWDGYAGRSVAEMTSLANGESIEQFVIAYRGIWLALRESPLYGRVLDRVVAGLFETQGDKTVAALLAELGLTRELLVDEFTPMVGSLAERALDDGALEASIRSRLGAFYAQYSGLEWPDATSASASSQ